MPTAFVSFVFKLKNLSSHLKKFLHTTKFEGLLEKLPADILNHIFSKLGPEMLPTLCSVACVSRNLRSSVNVALSLLPVDLSAFPLHSKTFPSNVWKVKKITFNCLHLHDSSIKPFLGSHVEELVLLKCCKFSYHFLSYIGTTCPNLRVLIVEFSGYIDNATKFDSNLKCLLKSCRCIESLSIKFPRKTFSVNGFILGGIYDLLPKTIKVLKLDPASASDIDVLLRSPSASVACIPFGKLLTHISLVVDNITNALLLSISHTLRLLVELGLKDQPRSKPLATHDLTDLGIKSLIDCKHLTSLSLRRSWTYTWFEFVTDTSMNFLAEGCKQLEYVKLAGFSKVTDLGFGKFLTSCLNLKKFEIRHADLTYLAFKHINMVRRPLVEVKLVSCKFRNSDALRELSTCSALEVLDLHDCLNVTDSCLNNFSGLASLTSLNLSMTNLTDSGMDVLGNSSTPISRLSLRHCCRITDKGVALLLANEGKISKTLSSLDLGYVYGITDKAITTIIDSCVGLTELCIRNCNHVTDASLMALGLKGTLKGESKFLRRLDMYHCTALRVGLFELFKKPLFHGLHWIGVGWTTMDFARSGRFEEICERKSLTICNLGCEMGCHDGWIHHC